jgi:putative membrane protein
VSEKTAEQTDDARVRDHLANERTYLAWIRTSVAMMGLGIVIAKLKYLVPHDYPESVGIVQASHIGWLFTAVGVVTVFLSVIYFLQTQREIRQAKFVARKLLVLILATLTGTLGLTVLWYLTKPTHPVSNPSSTVIESPRNN